jgi:protein-disulfide isomerase
MKLNYCLLASLMTLSSAFAAPATEVNIALPNHDTVIGKVGEKEIRLGDVENQNINKLRGDLYTAIMAAFQQQAVDALKESNPKYQEFKDPIVTESDIETFYERNQLRSKGSVEQLSPQIRAYMEGMLSARLNSRVFSVALEEKDLSNYLAEPEAYTVKIPVETAFFRGNEKATTMLMEFSDFQCPFCQKVQPTIQKLISTYGEKVGFGYRHLPLDFHKDADDAAIAIECAREQNAFDAMHALLFKQQRNQSRDELKLLAAKAEVKDLTLFNQCLDDNKYAARVARDIQVAQSVGINGTPGFIIGRYDPEAGTLSGELLSGAQPESQFVRLVEKYLQ